MTYRYVSAGLPTHSSADVALKCSWRIGAVIVGCDFSRWTMTADDKMLLQ